MTDPSTPPFAPAKLPRKFGVTAEHAEIARSARTFLAQKCSRAQVRKIAESETGHDDALWKGVADLGWPGLALPEVHGGAALGHLHLALLFEETGRALLPAPLFATTVAGLAIDAAGDDAQKARWLPSIASGETIATFAFESLTHVPHGSLASLLVAVLDGSLYVIDLATAKRRDETTLDPTRRRATIELDRTTLPAGTRLARTSRDVIRAIVLRATAILSAEMLGGIESLLQITRDYANEREQFNRKIGSFQAVSHPLANTMMAIENARSLVYAAAATLDSEGPTPGTEVRIRMAKAAASDAYAEAARRAIQLHGGFGFTWDCDVHFWAKRALVSRPMLGDARHHREHLSALLGLR
jgi:alkylation response protein AidB-like acyl-CoA dehydrogenase